MDRNEFMELVYETFADEPDNVLANGIIEAADAYAEHEKAQLSQEGTTSDLIRKFIDGLEEIFADLRERHVDDSVCGLCEYDGAYIGQSGDWCNECPGFNRDDCFKLSDKTRKEWTEEIITICKHVGNNSEIPNSSDCISRQQEIDALDTAIEHYDGIAEECRKKANIERNDYMDMRDDAYEARQLAQWLNELKYLREKIEQLTIQPEPPIIKCKDCKWWRKQKDSAQGRCRLLGIYPTGAWYCANGAIERRTDDNTD